jgi:hypothetical protein
MFNAKIDMSDLLHKLAQLTDAEFARDIAQSIADEAVIPELAKEPFRTTHKKMIFVSAKQRAFVIGAIRRGQIQVPYVRTGKIGMSEKHATTSGIDVVVPVEYSDLVRTKGMQAKYHADLWPTTDDIAEKIEGDIAEVIGTAKVIELLDKAGLL